MRTTTIFAQTHTSERTMSPTGLFLYLSVHLSVLLCSGSCGLIQINVQYVCMYVCMYSIIVVSSVVTLNTSVTEKVKKCNEVYCIKTHEHCILLVTTVISCYTKHILFWSVTESMKKRLVYSDSCTLYSNILSVTRHNTSRTTITLKKD